MSNALVAAEPRSVLKTMSERFGMEPDAFEATVRATCMRPSRNEAPATREEFAAFLLVAKEYGLNPLTKEIYAFPAKGGGIVPVVSIDGWVHLINSHPACDGFEFEDEHDDKGNLISCTCIMYRKDRSRPVRITEYLIECIRATDPWKMKHRMLRHKTLIQAARYAFGFAGVYDEDEAAKIADMRDVTPAVTPPSPPTPAKQGDSSKSDQSVGAVLRYWHHGESSSVWSTDDGANIAGKGDGMTEEIDEATFHRLRKEYSSEAKKTPPAPPKQTTPPAPPKREQTIDEDPFDADLRKWESAMAKAGNLDELRVVFDQRPRHRNQEQYDRIVAIKEKYRVRLAPPAADQGDGDGGAPDGGGAGEAVEFDPVAFRDDIIERIKEGDKEAVEIALADVEAAVEEGLLSTADKEEHFDSAFADAFERLG
jgi:hypothetical protein